MDDDTLDDSWIKAFKKLESDYDDFYKEAPTAAEMCFIYVNASNNVESVRKENFLLNNSNLSREDLISLIKNNQTMSGKKYKLISLAKYNITVSPEDVLHMLEMDDQTGQDYLTCERYLDQISFSDTVCVFQDVNALFFIFYEERTKTKKKGNTRRIIFKSNSRKTKRKRA